MEVSAQGKRSKYRSSNTYDANSNILGQVIYDDNTATWLDNIPGTGAGQFTYYANTNRLAYVPDANILSLGSNHRSIDNDQVLNIFFDIRNFVNEPGTMIQKALDRTQTTNTPDPNSNVLPRKFNESKSKKINKGS